MMKTNRHVLTFPHLRDTDLGLMATWLRAPHVAKFWSAPPETDAALHDKYFGEEAAEEGLIRCLICVDKQPVGFIQRYLVDAADHPYWHWLPEACAALQLPAIDRAMGMDLFIGETSYLGKGLGLPILQEFATQRCAEAPLLVIDPEASNKRAVHLYRKAGFVAVKLFDGPPPHMKPVPHMFMAAPGPALGRG